MSDKIYNKIDVSFGESKYNIVIGRKIVSTILRFLEQTTKDKRVLIISDSFFDNSLILKLKDQFNKAGFNIYTYSFDGVKRNKRFNWIY